MTSLAERLARPEVLALPEHRPRLAGPDDIRLDENENPYPPLDGGDLNRRAANQPAALISRFAAIYGVSEEKILAARGVEDAVDLLLRAFCRPAGDLVVIAAPAADFAIRAAIIQGASVEESALESKDFLDRARRARLTLLSSPADPTGDVIAPETIRALCSRLSDTIIVVDESFAEFSDAESLAGLAGDVENLVVLRSLSSAYGLAGAPCAAVIADPSVVAVLRKVSPASALPSPTIRAALAALSPVQAPIVQKRIAEIKSERARMRRALQGSPFVASIRESGGDFLFLEASDKDALARRLAARGVRVSWRPDSAPAGLRLTIGTPSQNDLALDAFGVAAAPRRERRADLARRTKETDIAVSVDLENTQPIRITTGVRFFDHMLEQIAKHGGFSLVLSCSGDVDVDAHHTIEDCMLAFGETLRRALGDKRGIRRFAVALPMDEARAEVALDLSGRPFLSFDGAFEAPLIGAYPTQMTEHAFRSFADSLGATLHISTSGRNDHHKTEACFKALGRALREAVRVEGDDMPSTKGVLA
ncbi:MAG: imidazoleglycerol-phosphate dehydratase HisB [Alphaproteobacteria bacterium]|nr:imidazoleglycerol-phosphate dehydratase HisB [Alphaproteobacteria bacterium]